MGHPLELLGFPLSHADSYTIEVCGSELTLQSVPHHMVLMLVSGDYTLRTRARKMGRADLGPAVSFSVNSPFLEKEFIVRGSDFVSWSPCEFLCLCFQ